MTNEDILKYLMDIKDKQLSACELAAVEGAIDIISDYDRAAKLSGRLTSEYETAIKAVRLGENYFACPRCGKRVAYTDTRTVTGAGRK